MTCVTRESVLKASKSRSKRIGQIQEYDTTMGEQQSQKRGVRSEAQKETAARDTYNPIPPANPVAGASGTQQPVRETEDVSFAINEKERIKKAQTGG